MRLCFAWLLATICCVSNASAAPVYSVTISPNVIPEKQFATLDVRISLNLFPDHQTGYLLESADFVSGLVTLYPTGTNIAGVSFPIQPSGGFADFNFTFIYPFAPNGDPHVTITGLQYTDKFVCIGFSCTPLIFQPIFEIPDLSFSVPLTVVHVPEFSETPLPAALPLFASGGALLGFLGWRRKRKVN
jgi:hypothetical protein